MKAFSPQAVLATAAVCAVALWQVNTLFTSLTESPPVAVCAVALIVVHLRRFDRPTRKAFWRAELLAALIGLLFWAVSYPGDTKRAVHTFMYLQFILAPLFLLRVVESYGRGYARLLWAVLSASLVYTFVVTLQALRVEPDASRMVTGSLSPESLHYEEAVAWARLGVTDMSGCLVYVFLLPVFLQLSLKAARRRARWVYMLLALFCLLFAFMAQYGTLFTLALLSVLAVAAVRYRRYRVWLAVAGGVFIFFLPDLFAFLASLAGDSTLAIRMGDLAALTGKGDMSGEAAQGRANVYLPALEAWLRSPLWGQQVDFGGRLIEGMNGHAIFLTMLVCTGLLGFAALTWLYRTMRRMAMALAGASGWMMWIPMCAFYAIGFLDSNLYAVPPPAILFLYIPLTLQTLAHDDNQ